MKSHHEDLMDDIYNAKEFETDQIENVLTIGKITEKDKFLAAKQVLLGLAILYVINILAFLIRPSDGLKLLDVATTTFPPLATLILASYFRDRH